MSYYVGQKLLCIKSWKNPSHNGLDIVAGNTYFVGKISGGGQWVEIDLSPSSLWGKSKLLPFGSYEIPKYFEEIKESLNGYLDFNFNGPFKKQICTCGFIKGKSIVHYRWCDTNEKGPISA